MQARACPHCGASQPESFAAICLSCDQLLDAADKSKAVARRRTLGRRGGQTDDERMLDGEPPFAIPGAEGMSIRELLDDIEAGGRFVTFLRCVSLIIVTLRLPTQVQYIRSEQSTAALSLRHTLTSLLAGWWGIPWGPIYTLEALFVNLRGGTNVTRDILEAWRQISQTAPVEAPDSNSA